MRRREGAGLGSEKKGGYWIGKLEEGRVLDWGVRRREGAGWGVKEGGWWIGE